MNNRQSDISDASRTKLLEIDLPGTFLDVRRALLDVQAGLSAIGLSEDVCGSAQIVLAEILNNVVEHAFLDVEGTISLMAALQDGQLWVEVRDNGVAMPDGQVPNGKAPDLAVDWNEIPEGGFGWLLIHDLTETLIYSRESDQNILRFSILLSNSR